MGRVFGSGMAILRSVLQSCEYECLLAHWRLGTGIVCLWEELPRMNTTCPQQCPGDT